ncbi:MAG: endo-1,4-beta-xylanase [Ruminococcus sp.]|nr:endo-1,4-beta-xylanase [Ruminococcus sp.]
MKLKSKLSKLISGFTAAVMCFTMLPNVPTSSAANVGDKLTVGNGMNQHKGVCDGYSYEAWIDTTGGSGSMTLGAGGTFKAEWNASVNRGNFLARRGLDFGSQKKATDYGSIVLDYSADYRQTGSASGNSRLCVYGWFQNKGAAGNVPLVEYYIIEDWVDWVPDGNGKMVTIDGAQYKIFSQQHTGPSINSGNETFMQYFSVRQSKRTSGRITVSDHFKAWAQQGWGIGNLYEVALNAEGWQSSGYADIKQLTLTVNGDPGPDPGGSSDPVKPVEPDANGNYFYDTFESGAGDWTGRGSASVTTNSKNYVAGSKSLYVSGREDNWHGVEMALDTAAFVPGKTYSFSTGVLQRSGSSAEMKMTLQYTDSSGTEQYDEVAVVTASSGTWTKLENTAYTIPSGASNLKLYVECTDSLTDFYIDEAKGAVEGKKSTVTNGSGVVEEGATTPPSQGGTQEPATSDSFRGKFGHLFKMGTSVSPNELNNSTAQAFIKKHFNSITPENALKPEAIIDQSACQQKGNNVNTQISLNQVASTLKFCEQNGIGVRGHTFVWYSQTPDWFFRENFSSNGNYVSTTVMDQRLESMIKNTFNAIKSQYPNLDLYAYDVCNELFLNDGGGLRPASNSNWVRIYGDDSFVIKAFEYARKYAPAGCKLYINDYNEYIGAKTNDIYNMAMKLKEKGLIDGIGMQSHLATNYPSASDYETALKKFISTGLEVSITELDIETKGNDSARAQFYENIFKLAVKYADSIPSFTLWGTHDDISWRRSETPLPFGSNYQPKTDFEKIMNVSVPSGSTTTTTTTSTTTTTTTSTTSTTVPEVTVSKYGDSNCDGKVNLADAVLIMQYKANPSKYSMTEQGLANADVYNVGDGVTNADALSIQKFMLNLISKLPESFSGNSSTKTTTRTTTTTTRTTTVTAASVNLSASFSSGVNGFESRGSASLDLEKDSYYSAGGSLKVSGRGDTWQGAAIALPSDIKAGGTYSFSAAVMQASGSAQDAQITLQYNDSTGTECYEAIASGSLANKTWTKLENTAFTIPAGATSLLMYVELTGSTADYYLDDVLISNEGTKSSVVTGQGVVGEIKTPEIGDIDPSKPMIAISFDDGTNPYGKRIIDALAKEGFTATFFYVGDWINDESQVRYAYEKGMEVANHTKSHPDLSTKSASEIRSEYDQCYNKLKNIIGAEPSKLLRLPYLSSNSTVTSTLYDVPMITCAIDTQDWNGASKDQIVNTVKQAMSNGSGNGSIVLCHETYASTAAAIEELAPYCKAQGWQIVSISEMFAAKGKSLNGGQIYTRA